MQAGYSLNNYILHDPRLGDNFFEYGYVGKFNPTTNYQYDQNPFAFETKDIRVIQENGDTIFETHTGAIYKNMSLMILKLVTRIQLWPIILNLIY